MFSTLILADETHKDMAMVVMKQPFNSQVWKEFLEWRKSVIHLIYQNTITRNGRWLLTVDFEKWVSRYPDVKQKVFRKALERVLSSGKYDPAWSQVKAFTKIEPLLKSTTIEMEDFDPRMISGCTDEFAVITGPYLFAVQEWLKKVWHSGHFITYSSGMSCDAIGQWFDRVGHENKVDYFMSDASKFDGNTAREIVQDKNRSYVEDFYYVNSSPNSDYMLQMFQAAMADTVDKRGFGYEGTKFKVRGTIASGHFDTSLGDTKINGELHFFIYCRANSLTVQHVERIANQPALFDRSSDGNYFVMSVCGDDNVSMATRGTWSRVDVSKEMLHFGYVMKPMVCASSYDVEYLSSLFWPSDVGTLLAPKPGRLIPKLGVRVKNVGNTTTANEHFKSNLMSIANDVNHVPILNSFVWTNLQFLKEVKARVKHDWNRPHVDSIGAKPTQQSLDFIRHRYGWTVTDLAEWSTFLQSSTCDPSMFSFHKFEQVTIIDAPP